MSRYSAVSHRESRESYPELREVLAPQYANLPSPQLEQLLEGALGEVSSVALESFWSSVKSFAQAAAPVLKQALPVVATVAGTALGGPLGGALGNMAGKALSGAIGGGAPPGGMPPVRLPGGLPPGLNVPQGGTANVPAAIQLLRVLAQEPTMQAFISMAMGKAGARQVQVGNKQVDVAAIANLVGNLTQKMASEYHQVVAGELSGTPEYLLGEAGELIVEDATDPVQRAEALLALFNEAAAWEAAEAWSAESEEALAPDEAWAPDDVDDLFDELDLIELYAEED
jgi:hypothetical protein